IDAVTPWLPLMNAKNVPTLNAMTTLVNALAFAAMSTDCLRRAAEASPSEVGIRACMVDEPNDRLERLMQALIATGAFPALLDRTRALLTKDDIPGAVSLLRSAAPTAISWESDDLDLQALMRPVLAAWEVSGELEYASHRLPKFGFSPELAR